MQAQPVAEVLDGLASSSADAVAAALARARAATRLTDADFTPDAQVHIAVTDPRLAYASRLCEREDLWKLVLDAWERGELRSLHPLRTAAMHLLTQLLVLLSAHMPNHAPGERLMDMLLERDAPWTARLVDAVGAAGAQRGRDAPDAIAPALAALRLFTAMAAFSRGRYAGAVMERFHWSGELSARLLRLRRRPPKRARGAAGDAAPVSLQEPDVRTQYMMLMLALITQTFHASVKRSLLKLGTEFLPAVFPGMAHDPPWLVQCVLLVLHEEVMKDTSVPRLSKVRLLNEGSISKLLVLYKREADQVASGACLADVVHHFLLSIATHPGFGVCYAQRGWYPKPASEDAEATSGEASGPLRSAGDPPTIYNKVLAGVLRQLAPVDDLRQQELALRILTACPELASGYLVWATRALPLEPRADTAWVAAVAFVGRVLALPVPSFRVQVSDAREAYSPEPPPLETVVGNTVPDALLRALGRGVRHTDRLVRYYTLLLLARCLQRCVHYASEARHAADELDEPPHGAWRLGIQGAELAWRRALPAVDAVQGGSPAEGAVVNPHDTMLQEIGLRVMALYCDALPSVTLDTRLDAGRLLTSVFVDQAQHGADAAPSGTQAPFRRLCQVHALHIMAHSQAWFDWGAKLPGTARSCLHFLLALYCTTPLAAIRRGATALLERVLGGNTLFAHDSQEVSAWLQALPRGASDAAPDAGDHLLPTTGEQAHLLAFLDECIQRGLKTPYRYLERARQLLAEAGVAVGAAPPLSPLLLVLAEQFEIRAAKRLLAKQESGVLVRFFTRLAVHFVAQKKPLGAMVVLWRRLQSAVPDADQDAARPALAAMHELLACMGADVPKPDTHTSRQSRSAVHTALDRAPEAVWELSPQSQNLYGVVSVDEAVRRGVDPALLILHSGAEQYAALVGALPAQPAAWTLLLQVLLERVAPVHAPSSTLLDATFDALHAACAGGHIDDALLDALLQHRSTHAWLAAAKGPEATRFLARLAACLAALAEEAGAVQRGTVRPLVLALLRHLREAPADTELLGATRALVPFLAPGDGVALVQVVCPAVLAGAGETEARREQLALLGAVAEYDNRAGSAAAAADTPSPIAALQTELGPLAALLDGATPEIRSALLRLLSALLTAAIPAGLDRVSAPLAHGSLAAMRRVHDAGGDGALAPLLRTEPDTQLDRVLLRATYALRGARTAIVEHWVRHDTAAYAVALPHTLGAVLELSGAQQAAVPPALRDAAGRVLLSSCCASTEAAATACPALAALYAALDSDAKDALAAQLAAVVDRAPAGSATGAPVGWLVAQLTARSEALSEGAAALLEKYKAGCLRWFVRRLAEDPEDAPPTIAAMRTFRSVVRVAHHRGAPSSALRVPLVEPVVTAALRHRGEQLHALQLALALLRRCALRADAAERHIGLLLARTDTLAAVRAPGSEADAAQRIALRRVLVALLHALVHMCPHALHTPTTLARVLFLYTGTQSRTDRRLYDLLLLHERSGGKPASVLLGAWSAEQGLVPTTLAARAPLQALLSLRAERMYSTCVHFPRGAPWRRGRSHASAGGESRARLYDPRLVFHLLAAAILERAQRASLEDGPGGKPGAASAGGAADLTGLEWLSLTRTGVLGVVVCALSSQRAWHRHYALTLLGRVYASLQRTSFRERDLLLLVLERVRDSVPPPPETAITGTHRTPPWLPAPITLFAAQCLRAVGSPHVPLFPHFFRFLLQRAQLDTDDVPLLYATLYSSSDQLVHERTWILQLLLDSLVAHAQLAGAQSAHARVRARHERRIWKRRHVWDLLLSMYDGLSTSGIGGTVGIAAVSRHTALLERIFTTGTAIPDVAFELVARRGFLDWVAIRVAQERSELSDERASFWLQLLANVCEAPRWAGKARHGDLELLRRLERLDRAMRGALLVCVLRVATAVGGARRVPSQRAGAADSSAAPMPWAAHAAHLAHMLLAYAALRGTPLPAAEAHLAGMLLDAIMRWLAAQADAPPALLATTHQCTLLLASISGTQGAVPRLFGSQLQLRVLQADSAARYGALRLLAT